MQHDTFWVGIEMALLTFLSEPRSLLTAVVTMSSVGWVSVFLAMVECCYEAEIVENQHATAAMVSPRTKADY